MKKMCGWASKNLIQILLNSGVFKKMFRFYKNLRLKNLLSVKEISLAWYVVLSAMFFKISVTTTEQKRGKKKIKHSLEA